MEKKINEKRRLKNLIKANRFLARENNCIQMLGQYPKTEEEQRKLLRILMNVRMPGDLNPEFLELQDIILQEDNQIKGIVDIEELEPVPNNEKLYLWQGDITRLKADAIVNAANSHMLGCFIPLHNCIDNAIHSAAGLQLREECSNFMQEQGHEEDTGKAKITSGYNLPAKHVIHTVGPIVFGCLTREDENLLKDCYAACLKLADKNNLKSIAFCCISTGEFHFPNERAAEIAIDTVKDYLDAHPQTSIEKVIFNVFKDKDKKIYEKLLLNPI